MSAHVLLNLLNKLRKRDEMCGWLSILSLFCHEFNNFSNTGARKRDEMWGWLSILSLFCHEFNNFSNTGA